MKFFNILFLFTFLLSIGCSGNAQILIQENATISISIMWPTRLILDETTDIAIIIKNNNIQNYKKGILINREQGNQSLEWKLYPGDYMITVLALKFTSNTASGLKNFTILTGDSQMVSLNANENKNLSITLSNISISANLAFEDGQIFYLSTPIPIKFHVGNFYSVLKFSGGKLYFTYNNGFTNVTEYKTIYVSDTEELGAGIFLSKVYPGSTGYPSNSFDLSLYAKFTISSDKIPVDFMSFYGINEIKIEISNYPLGHLEDGTLTATLNITIQ